MNSMTSILPPSDLIGDFKLAMRRLAATVTIISTQHEGERFGMAATAVNSVTTTPPTLLICVNKSARMHDAIFQSGYFCVNILGTEHHELVAVYGGKVSGEERFRHGTWVEGYQSLPCLLEAPANVSCSVLSATEVGSHTVFLGEVRDIALSGETRPLIYQEGNLFRTISVDAVDSKKFA